MYHVKKDGTSVSVACVSCSTDAAPCLGGTMPRNCCSVLPRRSPPVSVKLPSLVWSRSTLDNVSGVPPHPTLLCWKPGSMLFAATCVLQWKSCTLSTTTCMLRRKPFVCCLQFSKACGHCPLPPSPPDSNPTQPLYFPLILPCLALTHPHPLPRAHLQCACRRVGRAAAH